MTPVKTTTSESDHQGRAATRGQKITSFLWFDDQAEEVADFYTSVFEDSGVGESTRYNKEGHEIHGKPEGSVMTVDFQIKGHEFTALNGGSAFRFTPAISFFAYCGTSEEVDRVWERLSDGGAPLMPLDSYPFSEKYGWIQDKYGLSWQVMIDETDAPQKIIPSLLFVQDKAGKAEEAIQFYTSVFKDAKQVEISRYGPDQPDDEGTVMYGRFSLEDQLFSAMDSADPRHGFTFNEAISFMVHCQTQEEVDYYWEKLSADPKAEQCGWLKDKFGVSWQIAPDALFELTGDPVREKAGRVYEAMLKMKKIDIGGLRAAYEQR